MESNNLICIGDYVVIQRQKYIKLHKFGNVDSTAALGQETIELKNIEGQLYSSTFRMTPKENASGKGKRIHTLELCKDGNSGTSILAINRATSGQDNRHVIDNGQSQSLSAEEIDRLRDVGSSSSNIVSQIVENSKTFAAKTEYAQEKYLKKKEKKYYEFVQIKRTNIRMICDIMYRQCPEKIFGLRMDSLSQIISYSSVCGTGNYLTYESGTNGLIPAALINSIGANTRAQLIHMHPGNVPQKQALLALNLPQEQLDRCISVNIYSVLRQFYQGDDENLNSIGSGTKRKIDDTDTEADPPLKIHKNNDGNSDTKAINVNSDTNDNDADTEADPPSKILQNSDGNSDSNLETNANDVKKILENKTPPKNQWKQYNDLACSILRDGIDGLIIVAKEYPMNILKNLLVFVKPGRPIVIFNLTKEILMEMYVELKASSDVTNLRLTSNWLRSYQILPNRTHPDVSMNGNSGYLLCGYTVR